MDSRVEGDAWKHLEARLDLKSKKPFTNAKQMFEVLRKASGDVNKKRTAMNKFRDLRMTKDFSSFWAEFQVLSSQLDHSHLAPWQEVFSDRRTYTNMPNSPSAWQDLQDIDRHCKF